MQLDHEHSWQGSTSPSGFNKVVGGVRNYINEIKLFSRNARLYLLGSFLMGLNFQVFLLLLNLYLKELGFVEGDIGLIASSRAVGMTIIAIPAAILLSRVRLKPLLMATVVLFAFFSYNIVSSQTLILMICWSILSGMSFAFYRVASAPFYMRNSTKTERTHLFSFSFGMMILAGMVGSITSGKLAVLLGEYTGDIITGYQYTLYIGIALSLLALIPFGMIHSTKPSKEEKQIRISKEQFKKRGIFYLKITSANFLIGMGAGLVIPFLNLYFRDRFHLKPDTIGLYYFLVQFAMLAGSLAGPLLVKRFGLVRTIVSTQLASIPFMLTLSYSYILPLAAIAFIVRGGLMNLGVPIVTNLGMELSDKKEQGLVNSLLMVAWTSSWMVSSAIGGHLIEQYGYTFTMNITIFLYLLSSLIFYYSFRNVESRSTQHSGWALIKETSA